MQEPLTQDRKADFTDIYLRPDPRAYYRTLGALDYQIPQRALPVFNAVLNALPDQGESKTVVDVCSSYGINAALLRHEVDLAGLTARYLEPELAAASAEEVLTADQQLFAEPARRPELAVVGLDVAQPAIDYAVDAGLLADGWAVNLEMTEASADFAMGVAEADLIISTGGVGYVGVPTFEKLLDCIDDPENLWLAIFVLRVFDYADIADLLSDYGLVTERLDGLTFPQRRFADAAEQQAAIHDVQMRGLDPSGKEADGWFHADCFLSRPATSTMPVLEGVV